MLKKFFIAMGVIFTCVIASWLVLGFNAVSDAPANKAVAEAITRDLARSWNVNDLKPHCVQIVAAQLNSPGAQMQFNKLKPLGSLKRIEQAQQTAFRVSYGEGSTATVVMVAEFENGRANVTIRLKSEGKEMKLWELDVTPIGAIRAKGQQA
jgi:hypothetical protein